MSYIKSLLALLIAMGLVFISAVNSRSQTTESTPDTLLIWYKNENNDSLRVLALREIVNFWKTRDCDSNIFYSRVLANKARQEDQANFFYKGIYWLTNCYGAEGMYDSALSYAFTGIDYFKEDSISFQNVALHILAGENYRAMSMYDKSTYYLRIAWNLAKKLDLPHLNYSIANRLAAVYYEDKHKEDALLWADTSLAIGLRTSDEDYYLSNMNIKGSVLRDQNKHRLALEVYRKAYMYAVTTGDSTRLAEIGNNIANTYNVLEDPRNAIRYALPAYEYTYKKGIKALAVVSAEILASSYAKTGSYRKAYEFAREYEVLRHNLFYEERDNQIAEISAKYETEKKERQIQIQKMSLEQKDMKLRQRNIISIAFLIVLFVLLLFLAFRHWVHQKLKKANKQLTEKNDLILEQKNEITESASKLKAGYKKLQELDKFKEATTRMLVHDLKNPLNLLSNIDVFDDDKERISIVKQSSRQMLNLVLNMLDISKAENNKLVLVKKELKLADTLAEVVQEMGPQTKPKQVQILNEVSGTYLLIADEDLIRRVFVNLLTNAIRHSPQGGIIRINTSAVPGNMLRLSIEDEGPGIAAKHHQAIFEQFTQIRSNEEMAKGSTGLGLAFCKKAIEAHNWKLWVESELGKGANFIIEISDSHVKKTKSSIAGIEVPDKKTMHSFRIPDDIKISLQPFLIDLQNLPVNAISEIKNTLHAIRDLNDKNLNNWVRDVMDAAESVDENKYFYLIKTLSDECL